MPLPTSPMTLAAGTRTSSKIGWPVGLLRMPILCSSLPTETPGGRLRRRRRGDFALGFAGGDGEDDVEGRDPGVGDPVLGAVDDPLVAVEVGAGDHAGGVGAGAGLGEAEGGDGFAGGAGGEDAVLEFVGAEELDREGAELLGHEHEGGGAVGFGEFLDGDVEHEGDGAGAAVFGVEREAEDVVFGEDLADFPAVFAFSSSSAARGATCSRGDGADELLELGDLVGQQVGRDGGELGRHAFDSREPAVPRQCGACWAVARGERAPQPAATTANATRQRKRVL